MFNGTKRMILLLAVIVLPLTAVASFGASGTIGWAKTQPDGTPISVTGVITASFPDSMISYIESTDGSSGIAIAASGIPGQVIEVSGTIITRTDTGERMIVDSIISPTGAGKILKPIGMTNKTIGGGNFGPYIQGLPGGTGLNNVGLLVTAWGAITANGSDSVPYTYIDDGSNRRDGTTDPITGQPNIGIRVEGAQVDVGWYVSGTGISSQSQNIYNTQTVVPAVKLLYESASLSAPTVGAAGGNGMALLIWSDVAATSGYKVYRSTTETGTYNPIGEVTAPITTYQDKPLGNGATFWYSVSAVSGSLESDKSTPVSATTTSAAPVLTITSQQIDSEGILTVNYSLTQGTGGNPPITVVFEIDGEEQWDEDPTTAGGSWVYDTTQLPNGTHTVGIRAFASDSAGNRCLGYDNRSFTINNFINNLYISEIVDGLEPFQAKLSQSSNWTVKVRQYGTIIAQQSGTGTDINWLWDASGASEGEAEIEISWQTAGQSPGGSFTTQAAASSGGKFSTFWVTYQDLLPRSGYYQWASWYARDQKFDTWSVWYWADWFFRRKFNAPFNASYSIRLTQPDQFSTMILSALQQTEQPGKVSHVVWAGHGNAGSNTLGAEPSFLQASGWFANFVGQGDNWHGLTPFNDYNDPGLKLTATAIGPRIGNRAVWRRAGPGRGRPHLYQLSRRFKFAAVFACWSGRNTMPLALGIPKGRIPGCKCAFLGFKEMLWFSEPAGLYSAALFNALDGGQTIGKAMSQAAWVFNSPTVTPPAARLSNPILHGDPNIKLGRNQP